MPGPHGVPKVAPPVEVQPGPADPALKLLFMRAFDSPVPTAVSVMFPPLQLSMDGVVHEPVPT